MAYLRRLTEEGGRRRYGERPAPASVANGMTVEDLSTRARAWATIDRELAIIEHLGFAGYFLVVWDLVDFCRRNDIYCQGGDRRPTRRCASPSASRPQTP
ncbi:MAG: hypothetical protein WKF58_17175 [Ilumatobacteraceae bacterium]